MKQTQRSGSAYERQLTFLLVFAFLALFLYLQFLE